MRKFTCEMGCEYTLEFATQATDEEMEGTFDAHCLLEDEPIRINGWLMEELEEIG